MPLSLSELTTPKTHPQVRQLLLDALQGRGVVTKTGSGTGSLSTSGTPKASVSVVVQITTAGEPGAAACKVSTDGGATFGAPSTIPSGGAVAIGTTGVIATLAAGPGGAGTSFAVGDTFTFALATPTFPVTSWAAGSVARTLVEIDAQALADLTALVSAIARGGLLFEASGSWLALLAEHVYGVQKNPSVATQGVVVLTASAEAGPYTIVGGDLWVADTLSLATTAPKRFVSANPTPLTLPKGGTLEVPVQAESPGAAYNVAQNAIGSLLTSLPGVTVANSDADWVTVQGVDEETDAALQSRCAGRWAELGTGSPAAAYDLWARTASPSVTRTKVSASGTVAGQIDIYLAGPSGGVAGGIVTAVQTYIAPRAPLTSVPVVQSATGTAVNVTATLYGKSQYQTTALAAAAAALQSLIAATAIGGTIYKAAVIEALMSAPGVENAVVTTPAGDTALTTAQVATLGTVNLTWSNL